MFKHENSLPSFNKAFSQSSPDTAILFLPFVHNLLLSHLFCSCRTYLPRTLPEVNHEAESLMIYNVDTCHWWINGIPTASWTQIIYLACRTIVSSPDPHFHVYWGSGNETSRTSACLGRTSCHNQKHRCGLTPYEWHPTPQGHSSLYCRHKSPFCLDPRTNQPSLNDVFVVYGDIQSN